MLKSAGILVLGVMTMLASIGCHMPHGGWLGHTGGSQTYYSTETRPTTITLVDIRTGESLFAMDIPAGKQLTINFDEGEGDDPVHRPDLLRYQIFDIGTKTGKLRSSLTVPPANVLRIDVSFREGNELRPAPYNHELRADQTANLPDWWTPEGGPLPDDDVKATMYDD